MTKKKKILIGLLILTIFAGFLPDKVTCGTRANFTCAAPPLPGKTEAVYYYEIQPSAVSLLEIILQTNIRIYYASGHTE